MSDNEISPSEIRRALWEAFVARIPSLLGLGWAIWIIVHAWRQL